MKRVGIHQVNYFPWIGYFNKMAKSDVFVYLDDVQLADRGLSQRTQLINSSGKETYLTVSVEKHGHRDVGFRDVRLNENADWREKQLNFARGNYSKHPFYTEVMDFVTDVLSHDDSYLIDVNMRSVECVKEILGIKTETVRQSTLGYDKQAKKGDLMLALTECCGGDVYLSGNGAKKYMNVGDFEKEGVKVQYLTFTPFEYPQYRCPVFVPGLSILDLLFNVGMDEARNLFWQNIQDNEVFA